MPDKAWKQFERRIARRFGGKRTGPTNKEDVSHPTYSIECKLLSRPSFGEIQAAVEQAETHCPAGKVPVAVIKKKYKEDKDALAVMRLETFLERFDTSASA